MAVKISLTIEDGEHDRLRTISKAEGLSVTDSIMKMISALADGKPPPPTEPDAEAIAALERFSGTVMTADGGSVWASSRQRLVAALLDNGWFLISSGDFDTVEVNALRGSIVRGGHKIRRQLLVSREMLSVFYGRTPKRMSALSPEDALMEMVSDASGMGASEIHLSIEDGGTSVRIRVGGRIVPLKRMTKVEGERIVSASYLFSDGDKKVSGDNKKPRRATLSSINSQPLPLGVEILAINSVPSGKGLLAMFRLGRGKTRPPTLDSMGYHPEIVTSLREVSERARGLCIIAGGPGSPPREILASLVAEGLATGTRLVISIDVASDFLIPGIIDLRPDEAESAELRREAAVAALTSALDVDPDTLVVGEIAAPELAAASFRAAASMIQVWATITSSSALNIPGRLLELGADERMVRDPVKLPLLVAQRVLRGLCPHCRVPFDPAMFPERTSRLAQDGCDAKGLFEVRGADVECPNGCTDGHDRVVAVAESFATDAEMLRSLSQGLIKEVRVNLAAAGIRTMKSDALQKTIAGEIAVGEYLREFS